MGDQDEDFVVGLGLDAPQEIHTALIDDVLEMVAKSHAVCAELLRLSKACPLIFNSVFYDRFGDVLFDFDYLKAPEHYEDKVESSNELLTLSDELREEYLPVVERYFRLFEACVRYHEDLVRILEDLEKGAYIQSSFDTLMHDKEGKQLVLEAISMLGILMLLLDRHFSASLRQIIVVTHYRYVGTANVPLFEPVCRLCASTGCVWKGGVPKIPKGYPQHYFGRFPIAKAVISRLVGRLLSEDFYNQLAYFPSPEHRSHALANQGSHLFTLLFFAPHILESEFSTMRELVDKHFADNWVVSLYPGFTVDVCVFWESFKSAKSALNSIIMSSTVKQIVNQHVATLLATGEEIQKLLHSGLLSPDYLERDRKTVLDHVQRCNVSIRWLLLNVYNSFKHQSHYKKIRDALSDGVEDTFEKVVSALLDLVQLEDELQRHLGTLIESKQERWTQCQKSIMDHILDLGEFYSGSKVLSRDIKDEGLQKYFTTLSSHVKNLHPSKPTVTGRKIQQLVQALKDLEDFHQLSVSVQAKEYLKYIRKSLIQLTNIANISEFAMETLTVSSDLSYAWRLIDRMTPSLHRRISKKPSLTLGLRWLFLKLKSVLDIPLLRINECNSPDLLSVSEFWSNELVSYVKHVVEIIPVSIFEKLDEVFDLVSTFAYPHSYGGLSPASPANLFYDESQRSYEPTALTDTI